MDASLGWMLRKEGHLFASSTSSTSFENFAVVLARHERHERFVITSR